MFKMLTVLGKSLFFSEFLFLHYSQHGNKLKNILILYLSGNQQYRGLKVEGGGQERMWLESEAVTFLSTRVTEE